jgi:hypothetical protein
MIAGPMFSKYMAQIAPAYGTNPFPAPPTNMVNGTPARTTPTTPSTQAPAPAPQSSTPAPEPSKPGNGNGNG